LFLESYLLPIKNNSNINKFSAFDNCYIELYIYIDSNGEIWFDVCTLFDKNNRHNSINILPELIKDSNATYDLQVLKEKEAEMEKNDKKVEQAKIVYNELENNIYTFKSFINTISDLEDYSQEMKIINEVLDFFETQNENPNLVSDIDLVSELNFNFKEKSYFFQKELTLKTKIKKALSELEIKLGASHLNVNQERKNLITAIINDTRIKFFKTTLSNDEFFNNAKILKIENDLDLINSYIEEVK